MVPTVLHDLFVSYSGDDRARVRILVEALRHQGLRVYIDEGDIRFAHNITTEIQDALRSSKAMLVYYSASFPSRSACQYELRYAYLSALRADEIEKRILVVNPEDPSTSHLLPIEMRAHRYWPTWKSAKELVQLAVRIRDAVTPLDSPFPRIDFTEYPTVTRTTPQEPTAGFVGRYADRWAIHSALHRHEHSLTEDVTSLPAATLTGMTGVGKSSLVNVYVHDFGSLYGGGVLWTSLAGARGSIEYVLATYTKQLLELARRLGQTPPDRSHTGVVAWWHQHLSTLREPVLWVVDDVPPDLPDQDLAKVIFPVAGVHTLLIGQHEFSRGLGDQIRLRGMTADDGHELFTQHSPAADNGTDTIDDLVERLGGHPYAIVLAAAGARGRAGLWPLSDRVDRLTSDAAVLGRALDTVVAAIERVGPAERTVLGLSAVCAATSLPALFVRDVLSALWPAEAEDTHVVLTNLDRARLAEAVDDSWQVHQLVREAARRSLSGGELNTIAAVAAHKVISLIESRTAGLVEHGVALLDSTAGSPAYASKLNSLAARHYDVRGEPALSASHHENLFALHPDEPGHLVRAARAHHAAGYHAAAMSLVERLAGLTLNDLERTQVAAVKAAVLDAKGLHRDAEAIWRPLIGGDALSTMSTLDQITIHTMHIRNRRMLGHFTDAGTLVRELLANFDAPDLSEALIPARLELATVMMTTDDREGARTVAQDIVDHYHRLGMSRHINAIEATSLLQEAQFEVFILEKIPSKEVRAAAEATLRESLAAASREFGPANPRTLTIAVRHMRALVGLGEPHRVLTECAQLPANLANIMGTDHWLYLRAVFLLGQAHAQSGDRQQATEAYRQALTGQEVALGPGHPDTLNSRYELGVMQWLAGERKAARTAFRAVQTGVVERQGRMNDLYGKATTALTLSSFMPGRLAARLT